jgi:outer membrane protein
LLNVTMWRVWLAVLMLLSCTWATSSYSQSSPDLSQAVALIRAGKAAEALQLLEPQEDASAGNLEFDYLLGLAALEAGRADKATIALERALIVNPNHAGARLDLARAYFALGDNVRARNEFNIALSQDPPPNARAAINVYIARIDGAGQNSGLRASGYVEATLGRDTNVNNATSQSQVFVPVFGFNVQLAPTSQRTADNFLSLGGGGEVSYALGAKTSLFGGADARVRLNQHADTFNFYQIDVRGGAQQALGAASVLRASLAHQQYYLDHNNYRGTSGLNLEWRQALSGTQQLTLFGVANRVRYKDAAQEANDTNLVLLGAGFTQVLNAERRTTLSVSAFAGYERDVGHRIDGDRKLYGVRRWANRLGRQCRRLCLGRLSTQPLSNAQRDLQ